MVSDSLEDKPQTAPSVWFADILAPFRVAVRVVGIVVWTLGCWVFILCASLSAVVSRPVARKLRRAIARVWAKGFASILPMRLVVHGSLPKRPFFMGGNHLSWIDFFAVCTLLDAIGVVEEPVSHVPIISTLIKGLTPIFVRRVSEDTQRVKGLMVEALRRGESLIIAPESPKKTFPHGAGVHMFRGGLLDAAVVTGTPVHYFTLTYRAPEGYPPPSKVLLSGPNPFLKGPDGKLPESEVEFCGPERMFLPHFLGVLALPWFEFDIQFGEEPIPAGNDRIALANKLHDAVAAKFVPVT